LLRQYLSPNRHLRVVVSESSSSNLHLSMYPYLTVNPVVSNRFLGGSRLYWLLLVHMTVRVALRNINSHTRRSGVGLATRYESCHGENRRSRVAYVQYRRCV
jgi:hypothetical protein